VFTYTGGEYRKNGSSWVETQTNGTVNRFQEIYRDAKVVVLFDSSRALLVRLPVAGGIATWTTFDRSDWVNLYVVTPGT
ncbi:MAG: hypothetical protein QOD51_1797, partial [Candidatus Eremiobacteraeota bacterium]|jgi:hypothetical protein|nr:hypothetical protein [Candidatus Eremiobacteraeota bacterium]